MNSTPKSIEEYIAGFPSEVQVILQQVRAAIRKAAPSAQETISYRIPTFTLQGNLVHFAAYARHIGFYPASSGIEKFKAELADYKTSRGAVQFSLTRPVPFDLIGAIVRFRVQENLDRARNERKHG